MSDVKIDGMAFNTFIKALCNNRSIVSMELSGVKLDNVCFFALAEALKVNHKLKRLDLRRTVLATRSCEELAQIMKINTTLHRLQVNKTVKPKDSLFLPTNFTSALPHPGLIPETRTICLHERGALLSQIFAHKTLFSSATH